MILPLLLAAAVSIGAPCRPAALRLAPVGDPADFDGMSHGGTRLRLANRGRETCWLAASPRLHLRDRRGRAVPIAVQMAPTRAIRLPPGAVASASIRWVSAPVYPRSRCYDVAEVALALPGGRVAAPLAAHVCADARTPVRLELQPFSR